MLATRQSLHSVRRLSCRHFIPRPRPRLLRAFTTAWRTLEKLDTQTDEEYVRTVREEWGNNLPEGLLTQTEFTIYQRYYGQPARMLKEGEDPRDELTGWKAEEEVDEPGTVTLQDKDGVGIEMYEEEAEEVEMELDSVAVDINSPLEAKAYEQLGRDVEKAFRRKRRNEQEEAEEEEEEQEEEEGDEFDENDPLVRTHPLTAAGRFATFPSTIIVPPSVQLPTLESLSTVPNKHLDDAAHKLLGGPGLPDSPLFTNKGGKNLRDVWLNVEDSRMSDISSQVFIATLLPGYYAQALSALTELRRRLGGDWVLGHGGEDGGGVKNVLDVGAGGGGILAWKNIMEAEHARRLDEARDRLAGTDADPPPDRDCAEIAVEATASLRATVITAPDSLRHRISKFLDNTIFLPRLPDRNPDNVFHTPGQPHISFSPPNPKQPRKLYDLIIATNNLLPLRESHLRKKRLRELWSHLNPTGGVLLFLEKGTPLGFEAIARARASLLKSYIASPDSAFRPIGGNTGLSLDDAPIAKEPGAIVAPCTTHAPCPLFPKDHVQGAGRRDWCRFPQRYERPQYLQRLVGAARANFDNLQYSFVAVRRGADHRADTPAPDTPGALRRFAFGLPRAVMQPLKRHGHVILDVCTPAGTLERWTVPKSFGRAAFRDARKSRWGDLWALGAKTKVVRNIKIGGQGEKDDGEKRGAAKRRAHWSRGKTALGEVVKGKRERRRSVRWAAQRDAQEEEEEEEERY